MLKRVAKLSIKGIIIGVLLGTVLFLVYGHSQSPTSKVVSPRIAIAPQADSPLQLLSTGVDAANALEPHYSFSIMNTSEKTISAYAIRQEVSLGPGAPVTTTSFVHLPFGKALLQPHASRQDEGGLGNSYEKPPVDITLSVDFVEFADGSRWGSDIGKSAERLDGQRAGGRAALKKYREVFKDHGIQGLESALSDTNLIVVERRGSYYFDNGFTAGVNIVRRRLKVAREKNGIEGIRSELGKPLDSTDGRRDQ